MKSLNETAVHYVSYGSNTNYDRFKVYITGGKTPGSDHEHPGCDDKTLPPPGMPLVIDHELYFAVDDEAWWEDSTGAVGTGFISVAPSNQSPTLAVAYRLQPGQFEQVAAQEDDGATTPAPIDLDMLAGLGHMAMFPGGLYGEIVYLGADGEGIPYLSFTNGGEKRDQLAVPSAAYLGKVARGIIEVHELGPDQAAAYFAEKAGIKDVMPFADILAAMS